jgi:Na+-transporting methylmalonyl-CoA/oxaloacetate decarboxylase gamma subunit
MGVTIVVVISGMAAFSRRFRGRVPDTIRKKKAPESKCSPEAFQRGLTATAIKTVRTTTNFSNDSFDRNRPLIL